MIYITSVRTVGCITSINNCNPTQFVYYATKNIEKKARMTSICAVALLTDRGSTTIGVIKVMVQGWLYKSAIVRLRMSHSGRSTSP